MNEKCKHLELIRDSETDDKWYLCKSCGYLLEIIVEY